MRESTANVLENESSVAANETAEPLRQPFQAYALTFLPQLIPRVWGGRNLERYGKLLAGEDPFGESWEISDVEDQSSIIANGPYTGKTLRDLMEHHRDALLGDWPTDDRFPLLFKLLDAQKNLSVQVHPSDADLERNNARQRTGKTEAWVILEREPGARLIHGDHPEVSRDFLLDRLSNSSPLSSEEEEELFHWSETEPGDVVFVPAGTIHALGAGVLLLEVQQTSDITYRVYDWGRVGLNGRPRDLHLDDARSVEPVDSSTVPLTRLRDHSERGASELLYCEQFCMELMNLDESPLPCETDGAFHVLAGIEGASVFTSPRGDHLELHAGEFALIPAVMGPYELAAGRSKAKCLRVLRPR